MINSIALNGFPSANIAAVRQNRPKQTDPAQDASPRTDKTQKPAHPPQPHGHIPPGLARAAEKIASKIFSRADANADGTVTQQELSALHSRHARALASSDLFQTTTAEKSSDNASPITNTTSDAISGSTTETPTGTGVSESQLKEALTELFSARIGVTYTPPQPSPSDPSTPTEPGDTTTSSVNSIPGESGSDQPFTAVA